MENVTIDSIICSDIKICQPKDGFRFTTDSLLLVGFVKNKQYGEVIEIGAGSGIISVLLAKFFKVKKVYAIEINRDYYDCLCRTVELNRLGDIIIPINSDIKEYRHKNSVDMVISNPPYRKGDTGYKSKHENKVGARFSDLLTVEDIFDFSKSYLKTGGSLYLSFIADRLVEIMNSVRIFRLEPKRLKILFPDMGKKGRVVFVEYRKEVGVELVIEPPIFHNINGIINYDFLKYSDENWWKNRGGG
ncbi:MAG: methyltransferase [Calditerrivibrio sp.]|nr:methyltransferase [Calditerrivibrio sp.]